MIMYRGTCDIVSELSAGWRRRRWSKKEAMQGWRFAADAARITDGDAVRRLVEQLEPDPMHAFLQLITQMRFRLVASFVVAK